MDRKFNVKGYSTKTKIDMWDMMAVLDSKKKEEEDKQYALDCKQRQRDMFEFYNKQVGIKND